MVMKEQGLDSWDLRKPSSSPQVSTENTRGRRRLAKAPGRELVPGRYLGIHISPLAQMANGSEIVHIKQEPGTGFEVMSAHGASACVREGG